MELTIVLAVLGALLFLTAFGLGYSLLAGPNLGRRVHDGEPSSSRFDWLRMIRSSEKLFKPLGEMIPRSPEEMSRQEQRFVRAGIRRRDAPLLFYGIKIVLAVLLFVLFASLGYFRVNPVLFLLLPILLGALVPDLWLNHVVRSRKERIQMALPDMLDLAVVCVEAGLGMDQSLLRIGQELNAMYPDLSEELNLYSLEVNAGRKRADALRNLGTRTDVDDLKSFVAVLIQTDRFGTSVAQSLRVFSETLRTKRRQRAEEHAAKMSIKMLPPLVFFIFPAILIVILGPAVIAIIRILLPGLSGR